MGKKNTMKITEWNEKYSVGIRELDAQHMQLINILGDLHDAMQSHKTSAVLGEILNKLIGYTQSHFATEEKYMTQYNYPDLAAHKAEHEAFKKDVIVFKEYFDLGENLSSVGLNLTSFVKDWLFNHISGTDKAYGPFLNDKGIL